MFNELFGMFGAMGSIFSLNPYTDMVENYIKGTPSKEEMNIQLLIYIWDYTKFRKVKIVNGEYIIFKTTNRDFELTRHNDGSYTLKYESHSKYDNSKDTLEFEDIFKMEKYFRKRNYMKK